MSALSVALFACAAEYHFKDEFMLQGDTFPADEFPTEDELPPADTFPKTNFCLARRETGAPICSQCRLPIPNTPGVPHGE